MDIFPTPLPSSLFLLVASRRPAFPIITRLVARLAVQGPVIIIDAGNTLDAFSVARLIRRETAGLEAAMRRIQLARAFTCYQTIALLKETQADTHPKIVLDLLATFYDDSLTPRESLRLLQQGVVELLRLAGGAPVLVSVRPPPAGRAELYEHLCHYTRNVRVVEPLPTPSPPRLFD